MKLLTLNTHSLLDPNYEHQLEWFLEGILREKPDVIALQEVNQTCDGTALPPEDLKGQYSLPGPIPIRQDNHAARIAQRLWKAGIPCYWVWIPIKLGYGRFDEGVAILSLGVPIRCADAFSISKTNNYQSWRTRAALGIQREGMDDWFYSLHMGWWDDAQERFLDQWKTLNCCIAGKRMCGPIWLLGDFNSPDTVHGQGYEHMVASGWVDTWKVARVADSGITVSGDIDGWRHRQLHPQKDGMRLDYIWCSRKREIRSSRVMFNGKREPVVSDHFGVLIQTAD